MKEPPANVVVLRANELVPWPQGLPAKMDFDEVEELVRAAQRDDTWE